MKVNGAYANSPFSVNGSDNDKNTGNGLQIFEKGQIVEGIIREVSDKVSIDFSGREFTFSKETVQNAREGDIRKFKIMEVSAKSIVLKEVGSVGKENNNPIISTKIETDPMIFSENLKTEADEEESADTEDITNRITEEDYYNLSKELLPIEEYNLEKLERAITRIKEQKTFKQEYTDEQKIKIKEKREAVERVVKSAAADTGIAELIAERLIEANLPITENNIKSIERALMMAGSITKIGDNAKAYLIGNELEPTVQNIYKAEHSGNKKVIPLLDEEWEQLKEPAKQVIESAGYEVNNNTLHDAKWLIENELPLTKENFMYKQTIDDISESNFKEAFLSQAAALIKEKELPENANLTMPKKQEIMDIINDFHSISYEALLKAENDNINNRDISLQDIKKAQKEINVNHNQTYLEGSTYNIKEVTAKRQLEEIRLKLTLESGIRLHMKGIHIDTDSLKRVVEGLKDLEDAYYKSLMQEADKTADAKEVSLLKDTIIQLNELKESPAALLAISYTRREIITTGTLAEEGKVLKSDMEKAGQAYETVMTVPRKDLGDSIQKAFRNIDEILNDLNLETTQANQRAVRILSYNSMELNYENITEMKQYDAKVNDMLQSMQPAVTAEMIKRGFNPLNMTVDELREQADAVKEELSVTKDERYSEFLYRMDKKNEFSQEERKAYIGIYRLLHQVAGTDGAVIGSVIKSGRELTLSNLLTAVRTMKNTGINKEINDDFGSLTQLNKKGESITEQIQSGIPSSEYGEVLLKNIMDNISPIKLSNVSKYNKLSDMSLERLAETLLKEDNIDDADNEIYREKLNKLNDILKGSKESILFLKKMGIEDSISMIASAKYLLNDGQGLYAEINKQMKENNNKDNINNNIKNINTQNNIEKNDNNNNNNNIQLFSNELINNMDKKEEFQKIFKKHVQNIKEEIDNRIDLEESDVKQIELLKGISNNINLIGLLAEREYYEIPVMTDQGITNMNVTLVHNRKESGKLQICMSNTHGEVQINVSVKQKEAICSITAENAAGINEAKKREIELTENIEKTGILLKQINYTIKNYSSGSYLSSVKEDSGGREDTDLLYGLAKTIVMTLLN